MKTITIDRAVVEQALEALKLSTPKTRRADDDYAEQGWEEHNAAITDLRAALAEPVQEPVSVTDLQQALVETNLIDPDAIDDPEGYDYGSTVAQIDALHEMLFKSQRKPLTEEELSKIIDAEIGFNSCCGWEEAFARAIERAHGIGEAK